MSQGKWRVPGFAFVVFFLPIAAGLSAGLAPSFAQTLPSLPQATVDTTMPRITGNTYTVNAGEDLQAAIDQAIAASPSLNHLIVLQAGATFDGSFILRARGSATGWIVIRSSSMASLPPSGTRVTPAHVSFMPTLRSTVIQTPVVTAEAGSHHYRLVGLHITMTSAATPVESALVQFGTGGEGDANQAHHLILDRSWVDVPSTAEARNGVYLNASNIAVIDSRISGAQQQGNESHALVGWNSLGPILIQNNYLEAASINILFGGTAGHAVSGSGAPDVTIRRNYLSKQLRWKKDDPAWDGKSWAVKNLIEFKTATRVLVEGNILERSWGDAQEGWIVRMNLFASNPGDDIADVTWRYNILRNGANGFDICGSCSAGPVVERRVLLENNLIYNLDPIAWSGPEEGWAFMFRNGAQDITVRHNTVLQNGTFLIFTGAMLSNVSLTDNIANHGPSGVFGDGVGIGTVALDQYVAGWTFTKNALIESTVPEDQYPADNFFPADLAAVGFVDPANGDYHLAPSSPYKKAGTDGKDIGADIDSLLAATEGVVTEDPDNPDNPDNPGSSSSSGGSALGGGGGGGCFIATAAYGSSLAPQVILLKEFRDRHLMASPAGHAFVRWYYRTSPPVAEWVRQSPTLRALIRWSLWPVVAIVWLILHPVEGLGALIGGGASVWLWFRQHSKRKALRA